MPRPRFRRNVAGKPQFEIFKPAGIPVSSLPEVSLTLDEYEAIRLADYSGMYQENAAKHMNVSRQTFGRVLEAAHQKIAQALVEGACVTIAGGTVAIRGRRLFACQQCQHAWEVPYGTRRPEQCPECQEVTIKRLPKDTRKQSRHGRNNKYGE